MNHFFQKNEIRFRRTLRILLRKTVIHAILRKSFAFLKTHSRAIDSWLQGFSGKCKVAQLRADKSIYDRTLFSTTNIRSLFQTTISRNNVNHSMSLLDHNNPNGTQDIKTSYLLTVLDLQRHLLFFRSICVLFPYTCWLGLSWWGLIYTLFPGWRYL